MKRGLIVLLFIFCSANLIGSASSVNLDSIAKEQVKSRFLRQGYPERYYTNILILLKGSPTHDDSLIVNELVDTLKVLVEKWSVKLVPKETSNLVVEINSASGKEVEGSVIQNSNSAEIIKSFVSLNLDPNLDFNLRKKQIYYHLLRSLVVAKETGKSTPIPGSVFSESRASNITFNPVDFRIVRELYMQKYEDVRRKNRFDNQFFISSILVRLCALFVALFFVLICARKGLFKHTIQLGSFLLQGMALIFSFFIYLGMQTLFLNLFLSVPFFYAMWMDQVILMVYVIAIGIPCLVVIFFIERGLLKNNESLTFEILVSLVTSTVVVIINLICFFYLTKNVNLRYYGLESLLGSCALIIIGRVLYIYLNRKSESQIRQKDLQLAQLSELHKQAELQSLQAKINPHFLYNSLNSIAGLAHTDANKTEQMALALSDFFKYSINREQRRTNSLSDELNAIKTYLEIEKVRFGDRLNFEIHCPDECLKIEIPQLLIQPLVENAIKHGLSRVAENGLIRIVVSNDSNFLKIRVYDNGPAFPDGPLSGFGIRNTQERISLLYGAKATINWKNNGEKYIEINLPEIVASVKNN